MSTPADGAKTRRLSLRLDAGILVEGLILGRLAELPKRRHQDWLRSLLVQGYLAEGRLLRAVRAGSERPAGIVATEPRRDIPGSAFGAWLRQPTVPTHRAQTSGKGLAVSGPPRAARQAVPHMETADKPFAHLRKVIG